MMQGHVDEKAPSFFWVACYAEAPTEAQEKERETWRHSLAWRIKQDLAANIHRDRQLNDADKVSKIWQAGTLHLLTAAPRTGCGRARMTFEPPAEEFGPTLMFVVDYIGPLVSVFGCLQKGLRNLSSMQWPATGPVKAALRWDSGWEPKQDEYLIDTHLATKPFNALTEAIPLCFMSHLPEALKSHRHRADGRDWGHLGLPGTPPPRPCPGWHRQIHDHAGAPGQLGLQIPGSQANSSW